MEDKCYNLKIKLEELDNLKYQYCYNTEKLENEYCISLMYKKWLLDLEYQKNCDKIKKD
jgi:hypothetical protein